MGKESIKWGKGQKRAIIEYVETIHKMLIELLFIEILITWLFVDPLYGFPITPIISYGLVYTIKKDRKENKWLSGVICMMILLSIANDIYSIQKAINIEGITRILIFYTLRGVIQTGISIKLYKGYKELKKEEGLIK